MSPRGIDMSESKMREIREMFLERVHVTEIDDNQSLKELGLDSLDVVEMCLDLEEKYNVTFETEELAGIKTVGDLFESLEKKIG